MQRKRSIYAWVLFLSLAGPFCGSYLWLQAKVEEARDGVSAHLKEGLSEEETIILTFAIADIKTFLEWEHSKEFKYNGNMYDVIHTESLGDSISYRCYLDHKESKLKKAISQLAVKWANDEPPRNNQQQRIADFLKVVYCVEQHQQADFNPRTCVEKSFGYVSWWCEDLVYDPIVPPPKSC